MSNLTITFSQMFLLVNRTDGATVLLPSQGHVATLAGTMFDAPVTLSGVDVLLQRNGVDYTSDATLRPGARFLPFLEYVFHATIAPLPETSTAAVPANLNARAILAGGYMTELPASNPNVATVQWSFVKPDKDVTLTQALTDRVVFTLPLDPAQTYALVIRGQGPDQVFAIPPVGADLTILNSDLPSSMKSMRQPPVEGYYTLVEYALLYNLTNAAAISTLYPYPTAYVGGVTGGDQPVCGGGQTDDDPKDPPPPGRPRR